MLPRITSGAKYLTHRPKHSPRRRVAGLCPRNSAHRLRSLAVRPPHPPRPAALKSTTQGPTASGTYIAASKSTSFSRPAAHGIQRDDAPSCVSSRFSGFTSRCATRLERRYLKLLWRPCHKLSMAPNGFLGTPKTTWARQNGDDLSCVEAREAQGAGASPHRLHPAYEPRPSVGSATPIHLPAPTQGRSTAPIHPVQGPVDLRSDPPGRRNASVPASATTPRLWRTMPGCRRSSSMARSIRTPAQRCRTYEIRTEDLSQPTCTVFLSTIFTAYSPHMLKAQPGPWFQGLTSRARDSEPPHCPLGMPRAHVRRLPARESRGLRPVCGHLP